MAEVELFDSQRRRFDNIADLISWIQNVAEGDCSDFGFVSNQKFVGGSDLDKNWFGNREKKLTISCFKLIIDGNGGKAPGGNIVGKLEFDCGFAVVVRFDFSEKGGIFQIFSNTSSSAAPLGSTSFGRKMGMITEEFARSQVAIEPGENGGFFNSA